MSKERTSSACKLRQLVNEFGENIFSADNKILFCKDCEVKVAIVKRFSVVQHINTEKQNITSLLFLVHIFRFLLHINAYFSSF